MRVTKRPFSRLRNVSGGRDSNSRSPGPKPEAKSYRIRLDPNATPTNARKSLNSDRAFSNRTELAALRADSRRCARLSAVWLGRKDGGRRSGSGGEIGGEPGAVFTGHRDREVRRWRSTPDDDGDAASGVGSHRQGLGGHEKAVLGASDVVLATHT